LLGKDGKAQVGVCVGWLLREYRLVKLSRISNLLLLLEEPRLVESDGEADGAHTWVVILSFYQLIAVALRFNQDFLSLLGFADLKQQDGDIVQEFAGNHLLSEF